MTQSAVDGSPSEGWISQHSVSGSLLAGFGRRKTYPFPSTVSPATGEGWKLMHRLVYWRFNRGDAVLDRLLHLFEGARLDLAHALA